MTEKLKESISAFMDDEISEIEMHRLLRQFSEQSDEAIAKSWASYQQISALVRDEHHLNASLHMELHSRISSAIEDEAVEFEPLSANARTKTFSVNLSRLSKGTPAAGLALAASVVFAVFVSFNLGQQSNETGSVAHSPASANSAVGGGEAIDVQTVSNGSSNGTGAESTLSNTNLTSTHLTSTHLSSTNPQNIATAPFQNEGNHQALQELDAEEQKRLREYLSRHESMTRNNPYARTVTYKKAPGKN